MTTFAWCTDIHLDFLSEEQIISFAESISKAGFDGVLLSGDISNSNEIVYHLSILERVINKQIFFVLGNHDYYGGSVVDVRKKMKELTNMSSYLRYLQTLPYIKVNDSTAIVGHDGWYDGLNGNAKSSRFIMSDWTRIAEFAPYAKKAVGMYGSDVQINKPKIIEVSQKLAHEGTLHVMNGIKAASRKFKNIVVLTHFPPFKETHFYNGKIGDDDAQPWYTSKMMGDMLLDASKAYPEHIFTVLCGHTHGKCTSKITHNLTVHVGAAEYGKPAIQMPITIT